MKTLLFLFLIVGCQEAEVEVEYSCTTKATYTRLNDGQAWQKVESGSKICEKVKHDER